MLKVWGIIEEELWERTFCNLNETEFQIQDLRDVLPNLPKIPVRQDRRHYVMKSESHCYGAAGMLRVDVLSAFAETEDCDYFILPSSIYEILLVPDRSPFTAEGLAAMVREVNRKVVEPNERLAEGVYYFRRADRRVYKIGKGGRWEE